MLSRGSMRDWTICRVEGTQRRRAVAFIQSQFAAHFAARVTDDTDEVYAVLDPAGEIVGAFGLNRRPEGFFCRHYVGNVADAVAAIGGAQPRRIVELAHLCVRTPATLCRIIGDLARFLWLQADYLICTVTGQLAQFFVRKGLAPRCLARADLESLPCPLRDGWGDYYAHAPQVVVGDLAAACARFDADRRLVAVHHCA